MDKDVVFNGEDYQLNFRPHEIIFEITRWCNMECAHCLRGKRQRLKMDSYIYDRFYDLFGSTPTFLTGGEPLTNPEAIFDIGRYVHPYDEVAMITNGKNVPASTVRMLQLLSHHTKIDIECSHDHYHEYARDFWKIEELAEYMDNIAARKSQRPEYYNLMDQGRAKENQIGVNTPNNFIPEFDFWPERDEIDLYVNLYLNVNGEFITGCDYSYEEQSEHVIASIYDDPYDIAQKFVNYYSAEVWQALAEKMAV
jgi:hypothetical protein